VITRPRMFDILKQMGEGDVERIDEALGRRIARQANLEALVVASIHKFGERYTINVQVIEPQEDEYLFATTEQGEGQESIPSLLDRISADIRRGLKEKLVDIEAASQPVADVTSINLEAYQHYFKGEELINKLKFEEAIEEFEQAITLDSTFGLAYYRLAYASSWALGSEQLAKDQIQRALALIDHIPEKERYLVRAEEAQLEGGFEAGLSILKEMEQVYPDDKEMLYNIGDWSLHADEYATAVEYLEKVLTIDPTFERALEHLKYAYREMKQFDKMMEAARRLVVVNKVEGNFSIGDAWSYSPRAI